MLVSEIMNPKVDYINAERPVLEAAKMMADRSYGALPVERNNKMVGMITDRDIATRVVALQKNPVDSKVGECMSRGIDYCYDDDDVVLLAQKMKDSRHRRIPVVNRNKDLVGIVALKDLVLKANDSELTHETLHKIYT